jgi:hypothetical protein
MPRWGEAEKFFKPEQAKNYDALVFYEMNQNCSGGAQVVLGPQPVPESANCCPR